MSVYAHNLLLNIFNCWMITFTAKEGPGDWLWGHHIWTTNYLLRTIFFYEVVQVHVLFVGWLIFWNINMLTIWQLYQVYEIHLCRNTKHLFRICWVSRACSLAFQKRFQCLHGNNTNEYLQHMFLKIWAYKLKMNILQIQLLHYTFNYISMLSGSFTLK